MARLVIFVLTALLLTVLVGPSRANAVEVTVSTSHTQDVVIKRL